MLKMLLMVLCTELIAAPVTTESFSSLDREVAGLMDAWTGLHVPGEDHGILSAQIAVLRAEAAWVSARNCNSDNLPVEVNIYWQKYLKASADCIFVCREVFCEPNAEDSAEFLSASFVRWGTSGEEFLNSIESMR